MIGLALLLGSAVGSDAQTLRVSKKAKNFNFGVRAAVRPDTGDVFLVWTEIKPSDSTYSRVWGALLQRKGAKYKARKARMISPDDGYHGNARAVWLRDTGVFVVVWDTRRTPAEMTKIHGRRVKAKSGKPQGAVLTLLDEGATDHSLIVRVNEPDVFPRGAAEPLTLLVTRRLSDGSAEVRTVEIDGNLESRSSRLVIEFPDLQPVKVEGAAGWSECSVTISRRVGLLPNEPEQIQMDTTAEQGPINIPGGPILAVTINQSGEILIVYVRDGKPRGALFGIDEDWSLDRLADRQLNTGDLADLETTFVGGILPASSVASQKMQGPPMGFLLVADQEGPTSYWPFDRKGQQLAGPIELFDHGGKMTWIGGSWIGEPDGERLAGSNAVVFWLQSKKGGKQEVMAHVFRAES